MGPPFLLTFVLLFHFYAAAQNNEPELVVEGNNLIFDAGTGNIVMRYASGTETPFGTVTSDLQQLRKANDDLKRQLIQVQSTSQQKIQQLLTANDDLKMQLLQARNVSQTKLRRFADCQAQGRGYNSTADQCVPLVPQCSREGETLEFQSGPNRFVCSDFLLDTVNNFRSELTELSRQTLKIDQIGDVKTNPGLTCREIKVKRPSSSSGVYWVAQNGTGPYQVYCDMLTDGGGWLLITVIKTKSPVNYEKKYPLFGMNEDKLLADRTDDWASMTNTKINAIFNARADSMLRIYVSGLSSRVINTGDGSTKPRTYYLRNLKNPNLDFDLFRAIRYVPEWGVKANGDYKLNYYREGLNHPYNVQTHDFTDAGKTMQHWENQQVTVKGTTYTTSRHGIVGDCFSGCEWLFQFHHGETSTEINCLKDDDVYAKLWIK